MKKIKIGKGYWQRGYGRGFKKNPVIWNINGKAYAKDSANTSYQTDLEGYVMVNTFTFGTSVCFSEVGLISQHKTLNT